MRTASLSALAGMSSLTPTPVSKLPPDESKTLLTWPTGVVVTVGDAVVVGVAVNDAVADGVMVALGVVVGAGVGVLVAVAVGVAVGVFFSCPGGVRSAALSIEKSSSVTAPSRFR